MNGKRSILDRIVRGLLNISYEPAEVRTIPYPESTNRDATREATREATRASLYTILAPYIRDKQTAWSEYEEVRNQPLTEIIIKAFTWDIIYNKIGERLFNVEVRHKKSGAVHHSLSQICSRIVDDFKIEEVIKEHIEYLLVLGEIALKIDKDNLQIDSPYNQTNWLAVYKRGEIIELVNIPESDYDDVVIFAINRRRIVLRSLTQVTDIVSRFYGETSPTYDYPDVLVIGEGIFTEPVLKLLKQISTLDDVLTMAVGMSLINRHIVYLNLPPATPPENAWELAHQWESKLNQPFEFGDVGSLLSLSSRFRVVPIFGEKSRLDFQEVPGVEFSNLEVLNNIKVQLASLIPIPPQYLGITSPDESVSKTIALRYGRLLYEIRSALSIGIREFLLKIINLPEDYELIVKPSKVPGLDELTLADHSDALSMAIESLSRAVETAVNLTQLDGINKDAIKKSLEVLFDAVHPGLLRFEDISERSEDFSEPSDEFEEPTEPLSSFFRPEFKDLGGRYGKEVETNRDKSVTQASGESPKSEER